MQATPYYDIKRVILHIVVLRQSGEYNIYTENMLCYQNLQDQPTTLLSAVQHLQNSQ